MCIRDRIKAGGHLHLYDHGMLHAKATVIDDRVALVGSPNFDLRSLFVNFEIGMLVYSKDEVDAIRAWIDDLLKECRAPVLAEPKFFQGIAEDLCRLMAPLL